MKNKFFKKALSVFTAMAMALSLMTGIPFSELGLGITVSAETTTYDVNAKTIAGLGTSVIVDPTAPANDTDAWNGSYVYYGNYDADGDGTAEPVKYRVLDASTTKFGGTTMFLDCDSIMYYTPFDNDKIANEDGKNANDWSISDVKNSLNGDGFLNKAGVFTTAEKNAIAASTVEAHPLTTDSATGVNVASTTQSKFGNYVALTGEQIFLLDAEDVSNGAYGYRMTDSNCENHKKTGSSKAYWWLRSADCESGSYAGTVHDVGSFGRPFVHLTYIGVSPALNLNLSSVIFSSVISGTAGATGAEYKLTLLDGDMTIAASGDVTRNGKTVTVPYSISGTNSANATQVSVLILNKEYTAGNTNEATVLDYQKLNVDSFSTSGTGSFTLPDSLSGKIAGTDYHMYILAEDVYGEKETDYASEPVKVEKIYLDISEATAVQNGTLTYDGTAQTPTFTVTLGNATLTADDYDVTVTAQTNAGSYTATITGKGNYRGTISNVTWSIGKATPSVTAPTANTGLVYKGTAQELISAGSTDFGTLLYSLDNTIYSEDIPTGTDVGSYTVYYKVQDDNNVNGVEAKQITASIGKASVTVTAQNYTVKFGNPLPESLECETDGLIGTDTLKSIGANVTIGYENDVTPSAIGDYTIVVSGSPATTNYKLTYVNGTLTITKKEIQTITAADVTFTYGETGKKITATTSGDGKITYSVKTGSDVISVAENGTITAVKAGTAIIEITATATDTYEKASKTVFVKVNKAAVTIKANSYSVYVGDELPTFGYTVTGLVSGDSLNFTPVLSCAAADTSTVNTYTITITINTAEDYKYIYTAQNGTLTVKKKSSGGSSGGTGGSGGSGGSSGGGSYRPTTPTTTNPSIGGSAKSWSDVAADLGKLTNGSEATIELNGSTSVPVEVIKAIATSNAEVTLKVDDVFSWTIDGSEMDAKDTNSANLSIIKTTVVADNTPRGTRGTSFSIKGTNVKSELNINFKKTHSGEFANLFKKVDGKLVFVDNVKVDKNGAAIGLDASEKGEYVVMLGEFSDRPGDMDNDGVLNAKDALAALKNSVGIEAGKNPLVGDINGDGYINAKDALIILKKSVGMA